MLKQPGRKKDKQAVFICQISEGTLKIIKFLPPGAAQEKRMDAAFQVVLPQEEDGKSAERIVLAFKKLGFINNNLILSLPRNLAVSRWVKIPSQSPQEIEKIVSLQAPSYLPYPAEELVSGYQVIAVDKQGFSCLNLIIAHKDVINRYLKLFHGLKPAGLDIFLSSAGLCNFYNHAGPKDSRAVLLADIDSGGAELAVVVNKKLAFSRYFKLNRQDELWQDLFIEEIDKTRQAYSKEEALEAPDKIFILGETKGAKEAVETLKRRAPYPAELLSYGEKIAIPEDGSFVNLIGLGLEKPDDSLNLLPAELKVKAKKAAKYKQRFKTGILLSAIILIWISGLARNLDNKSRYLHLLRQELAKLAKEAKPLEDMEKTLNIMESRRNKDSLILDMLYSLHQNIPAGASLYVFSYQENGQIIIRGQAQELASVFAFIAKLEESAPFKQRGLKVGYATKKRMQNAEVVEFELAGVSNEKNLN